MEITELKKLQSTLEEAPDNLVTFSIGDEVQFVAKPNRRDPSKPIFVREDGKVGFSNLNSIPYKIGDTIKGRVKLDTAGCFFIEVHKVVKLASEET